jgi:hypothetical protein
MQNFNQEPQRNRSSGDFWFRCVDNIKAGFKISNSTLFLDPVASEKYPNHILVEAVIWYKDKTNKSI